MAEGQQLAMDSLRAAIRMRDSTSVSPGDVEALITSAADIQPGTLGLPPVRFLVAQNLLRRKDISDWDIRLIESIAALAALDSTNPDFFLDPGNKEKLALAIRGAKFESEPVSWWGTEPGFAGGERSELGDKHVTVGFQDNTAWLAGLEFDENKWGFDLAVFTVGVVPAFGR